MREKRVPRLPEVQTAVEEYINQREYFEGDRAVKLEVNPQKL